MTDARVRGALGTGVLFLAVQLLAVGVAPRLSNSGVSYGDGGDALVPLVLGLLAGTLLSLVVGRVRRIEPLVRVVMFSSLGVAVWVALSPFVGPVPAGLLASAATAVSWSVPRWEVRNVVAVVAVGGAAGLFGASLTPEYAVVALLLAAAYDVYAVYVSGHMATVANAGGRMEVPSMFVVPTAGNDTETRAAVEGVSDEDDWSGGGREDDTDGEPVATVLGAGDALFPAILTASVAAHDWGMYVPLWGVLSSLVSGQYAVLGLLAPEGWGVLLGSVTGFLLLQAVVHRRGGMHAGLPFVNGGAILGFVLATLLPAAV